MRLINLALTSFLVTLFLLFAISTTALAQFPGFGGNYSPVDPDHVPKDPFSKRYSEVSQCEVQLNSKIYNLNNNIDNENIIFEILHHTNVGRQLIEQFQNLNQVEPHEFLQLTESYRRKYNIPINTSALMIIEDNKRRIYLDPQQDLGLLLFMLPHELAHAIDPRFVPFYQSEVQATADYQAKKINSNQYMAIKNENSWLMERTAFNLQDQLISELIKLIPCYEKFLDEHRLNNGLKLLVPTPDSFIIKAYNLPADIAKKNRP